MHRCRFLILLLAPISCGSEYTARSTDASTADVGGANGTTAAPAAGGANGSSAAPYGGVANATTASGGAVAETLAAGSSSVGGSSPVSTTATFVVNCGLPKPSTRGVAKPVGAPGNLRVLNWAGFKSAVSYTFDDANTSQIDHYAELQALRVPFTFYLWTGKSEAANPIWAQALKDGHELGNHTAHHTQSAADADIDGASAFILEKFGVQAWTLAAPYGDMSYSRAAPGKFLANRGIYDALVAPLDNTNQYNLPCTIPDPEASASVLNLYVDSARRDGAWRILLFHGFVGGTDGAYHAVYLSDFVANVEYAKSFGDVWLDTMVNVTSYWIGQKLLAAASPKASVTGSELTYSWTLPTPFPPGKCLRISVDGGTVKQRGTALPWDERGYYEISLDAGSLSLSL